MGHIAEMSATCADVGQPRDFITRDLRMPHAPWSYFSFAQPCCEPPDCWRIGPARVSAALLLRRQVERKYFRQNWRRQRKHCALSRRRPIIVTPSPASAALATPRMPPPWRGRMVKGRRRQRANWARCHIIYIFDIARRFFGAAAYRSPHHQASFMYFRRQGEVATTAPSYANGNSRAGTASHMMSRRFASRVNKFLGQWPRRRSEIPLERAGARATPSRHYFACRHFGRTPAPLPLIPCHDAHALCNRAPSLACLINYGLQMICELMA